VVNVASASLPLMLPNLSYLHDIASIGAQKEGWKRPWLVYVTTEGDTIETYDGINKHDLLLKRIANSLYPHTDPTWGDESESHTAQQHVALFAGDSRSDDPNPDVRVVARVEIVEPPAMHSMITGTTGAAPSVRRYSVWLSPRRDNQVDEIDAAFIGPPQSSDERQRPPPLRRQARWGGPPQANLRIHDLER
jgi:hypothetical protein